MTDTIIPGPVAQRPKWQVAPEVKQPPEAFKIVVDTREQAPLFFPAGHPHAQPHWRIDPWAVVGTLGEGDYSLLGHESRVRLERKSIADLFGSTGQRREPFGREFDRLAEIAAAGGMCGLLIEGNYRDVVEPDPELRSDMNPVSVEGTIFSWCQEHGIGLHFAGSARLARRFAFRWFATWFRHHGDEL